MCIAQILLLMLIYLSCHLFLVAGKLSPFGEYFPVCYSMIYCNLLLDISPSGGVYFRILDSAIENGFEAEGMEDLLSQCIATE